ncbi:hypothetical protein PIB30_063546 [Stylosanthes scabra]|uniref:Uncharacterized protein n=1 Tax=Stylosanthes scabra TaxID=79078 RepID=A0ABU6SMM9_9FABA|nr:hypothetical protein [Stylosanthes scabra]
MKVTNRTAAVMAGSTSRNGARAADTAAAVMAEGTTAARAGSTETTDTVGIGQGEAAEAGSACKPHQRWRKRYISIGGARRYISPAEGCGLDPDLEPPPYSMNRASSRSASKKKSRSGSCGAGPFPPDPGPHPPPECPHVDRIPPLRPHRLRPAANPPAHCWTHPHPSAGYQGVSTAPVFCERGHRAVGRSDLSPELPGAHHPATEIPWDLAAGDPKSGTDGDRQPPTSQCIPWLANGGGGWARSESDDLGTSGCVRSRTSMQAHRVTICCRP